MKILALDPGITTGYALIDETGELLESGNLQPEDLDESILKTIATEMDLDVVVEELPLPTTSQMNMRLRDVVSSIHSIFPTATLIKPALWKSNLTIANYPFPENWGEARETLHQRDAFRIAIYWLIFHRKREISNAQ